MLEQPTLLLLPWIHALDVTRSSVHQGPRWVRSIVAPATNHPLGFAAWGAGTFAGWLAWLGRKTIQVFESEDESLLLTLYRFWGLSRTWEVLDAEERRVGRVIGDVICDGLGARLATMGVSTDGSESVLRGEEGTVLASWQGLPGQGCYFRFGEAAADNPFLRMTALAGVLALPPWPGDLSLAAKPA